MDFALNQMKAMGWSEGKGLGASENGITTAIKPSTQKDTRGLGFTIEDSIQLKNQWWSEAYNAARKGLKSELKITSVGVMVKAKKQDSNGNECSSDTKKGYSERFVSAGVLNNKKKSEDEADESLREDEAIKSEKRKKKKRKHKAGQKEEINTCADDDDDSGTANIEMPTSINFNEVFKEAKGMTCHKAARLGIKMCGKMKRIQEQEEEFLKKIKSS